MKKKLSDRTLEELWLLFPVILRPYNPEWPQWYADEAAELKTLFASEIERMRHIGSTSVPGLTAKPTVDILLEIRADAEIPSIKERLLSNEWIIFSETATPDFRLDCGKGYTENGFAERVFHLHIRHSGDWDEPYFCEYLRLHSDAAEEYVQLKMALAVKFVHDRNAYTEEKTDFIKRKTAAARTEFPGKFRA